MALPDPARGLRKNPLHWPAMSESEAARHFIAPSRLDARQDEHGPVTALPLQFLEHPPGAPDDISQGFLACLCELQEALRVATGMVAVSLAPQTELQSAFASMAMMRAYHDSRGDSERCEVLTFAPVNDVVAEATTRCGYTLRTFAVNSQGVIDVAALTAAAGSRTAALLLTSDCSPEVNAIVRDAGGLLHGHGTVSSSIGMDVFSLSIAGNEDEPDAWAVAASQRLAHFVPLPIVGRSKDAYRILGEKDLPLSIGRLGVAIGNTSALMRAYLYASMRGITGEPGGADGRATLKIE